MEENMEQMGVVFADEVHSINPELIDTAISRIVRENERNGETLQQLVLECSAALSTAEARNAVLKKQGVFSRVWNMTTGGNSRLRCSIENDNIAAQYAMQKMIGSILDECTKNQALSLAVKAKLEGELLRLEAYQMGQDRELNRVRGALVSFYRQYLEQSARVYKHTGRRCDYCREEILMDQIVCPYCGTLQTLKLERLPPETQESLANISALVKRRPGEWNPGVCWDIKVREYAERIAKAQAVAKCGKVLLQGSMLDKDINVLVKKCKNAEFQIAVVGELKAGKSMLMNALIGTELASTGPNSETAALTKFRASPSGSYVDIHFFSQTKWDELNKSARGVSERKAGGGDEAADAFRRRLLTKDTMEQATKYIGSPTKHIKCHSLKLLRSEIKSWTSASSAKHLFVSEVVVGIDRRFFDMPEEVVFVDTPGLDDTVAYRSKITEEYISKADAVIAVAVLTGLRNEVHKTITRILDQAGNDKDKVFIVGTQKDKKSREDCNAIIYGENAGWLSLLGPYYKSQKNLERHIFPVSAYLHLCMLKAIRSIGKQNGDKYGLSDEEYQNLEGKINTLLERRGREQRYYLEDLPDDKGTIEKMREYCGITHLKRRLRSDLIAKAHDMMVENIGKDYDTCYKNLCKLAWGKQKEQEEKLSSARGGGASLEKALESAKRKRRDLENEQQRLEATLDAVKMETVKAIESI